MGVASEYTSENIPDFETARQKAAPAPACLESGERTIISFASDDPEDANNWPEVKKSLAVIVGLLTITNGTFDSALPTGASTYIAEDFHINEDLLVLPLTLYLLGYGLGPLIFSPLSELWGRKPVMLWSFILFTGFNVGCALAPSWPSLLAFRGFAGLFASCPMAVVGGLYADIYRDPVSRGRATMLIMACTTSGPILGPIVAGFVSPVSWRWAFWIALIFSGVTLPLLILLPETYRPILETRRAARMRKETGNPNIFSLHEVENVGATQLFTVTLARPVRMLFTEPIVLCTCIFLVLANGIYYLFFEAYPLIFQGVYRMSKKISGLAFLPIAFGAMSAGVVWMWYDRFFARAQNKSKSWASKEESRRLPLACVGGPLYVAGMFWLGWSANPHVHWIVPVISGYPFGLGTELVFMAMINYLTDAYGTFAASATAASTVTRNISGALLPLAAKAMYKDLGIGWATSLVAFLSLAMSTIPFVFIRYGPWLRSKSQFCQLLAQRKAGEEDGQVSVA